MFNQKNRLSGLLKNIPKSSTPSGWELCVEIAVGGLTEIGFSRQHNNLLLAVSSSGRGVIDCCSGEKIARDYEEYGDWYDPFNLSCLGIGPILEEIITISGLCGGGMPTVNHYGETLTRVAPEWPIEELIWCPLGKDPLIEQFQAGCIKIASDYFRCAGFSWNGEFIVAATSSDITIWKRTGDTN